MGPPAAIALACIISLTLACSALARTQSSSPRVDKLTYHNDPQRSGWNDRETVLTPHAVSSPAFGLMWRSPPFEAYRDKAPRLFASPLYVDRVPITAPHIPRRTFAVLYAVSTTGYVYAVNAFAAHDQPAGKILWRARLTQEPCGAGTLGNLSTPVIDLKRQRLYVTSCDEQEQWRLHALDIRNGNHAAGWPARVHATTVNVPGVNKNGSAQFPDKTLIQRGALNLAPEGSRVYVTFGADFSNGWIVAVGADSAKVETAFSSTAETAEHQGGMWASGGPAVDREGRVHVSTGASSSPALMAMENFGGVFPQSAHNWGQSIIQLRDDPRTGFELVGTYTPFNYCQAAAVDIDLGSSSPIVIDLDPAETSTHQLLALGGGKQGNFYLLDRARMPGRLDRRAPCSTDPQSDRSLLPPEPQPHFGARGPINIFGPYAERYAMVNQARSRTTAAHFRDSRGRNFVFVTGSAKTGADFGTSMQPGLARVEIVTRPGTPAYPRVDQLEQTQIFHNPGSPIVTSDGGRNAVVWVLDANAPRTAPLYGPGTPRPMLYAFDALNLRLLWKSEPGALHTSGKYNEPTAARGAVFVGTDRIEAFGLRAREARALAPATFELVAPAAGGSNAAEHADGRAVPTAGADLFVQRCAGCHDVGLPGIPARDKLAAFPKERIVHALTIGVMQPQALGLTRAEIEALATYLTAAPATTRTQDSSVRIADVTTRRLLEADAEPGQWLTGGRDYRQTYYSPLTDIDKTNVKALGVAWSHEIESVALMEATPIVVDGTMFTSGNRGSVYALDAATGASKWTFKPQVDPDIARKLCCGQVNRGVAVWKGKVYVGSIDGNLYALDAQTGEVLWKADTLVDHSRMYSITGMPYIADGRVIIGNSGADLDARGYISAFDLETGKLAWRFFTVPGDPGQGFEHPELAMAAKTWAADSRWDLGGGGTAWDGMAYDPELKLLYVGTGNGAPWMRRLRSPGGGDNLFLSSILAIDPETGRLVWHYQTTPGENWDYTATAKMILADLRIDGRVRKVIMQAPKNGFFYVLDRASGELLSAKPFAKVTWASHIDLQTGRPVETQQGDYSQEPKLIFPGAWGGHSWPPMSYNARTGLVYLPVLELPMVFARTAEALRKNQFNMAVHVPLTAAGELSTLADQLPPIKQLGKGQPDYRARVMLKAWDPVKQRVAWSVDTTPDERGPVLVSHGGGVMSTATGLVFQGRITGELVALDAETGARLHHVDVGSSMAAAPMTYKAANVQYIAIMASGDASNGAAGRIVAFKLGGSAAQKQPAAATRATSAVVPPPVTDSGTPEAIASGRALFERYCAACHIAGSRAPDLARMSARAHEEFMDIVLKGTRAEKGMGNFGTVLSTRDAQAIHAFVTRLAWDQFRKSREDAH